MRCVAAGTKLQQNSRGTARAAGGGALGIQGALSVAARDGVYLHHIQALANQPAGCAHDHSANAANASVDGH
eukprot:Skav218004  [mRNA]  locus=scaffold2344:100391:103794:+ [translate_table: standard]